MRRILLILLSLRDRRGGAARAVRVDARPEGGDQPRRDRARSLGRSVHELLRVRVRRAGAKPTRSRATRPGGAASISSPSSTSTRCERHPREGGSPRSRRQAHADRGAGRRHVRVVHGPGGHRRARARADRGRTSTPSPRAATRSDLARVLGHAAPVAAPRSFHLRGRRRPARTRPGRSMNVDQGGTTLPDRDYYLKDDPKNVETREAYLAYTASMFELAGQTTRMPPPRMREGGARRSKRSSPRRSSIASPRRDPKNRDHRDTREQPAGARARLRLRRVLRRRRGAAVHRSQRRAGPTSSRARRRLAAGLASTS